MRALREQVQATSRVLGAAVFSLLIALRWLHTQFVRPMARWMDASSDIAEESVKAVVREWFAVLNRNLNTFSAFVLALFTQRSYRRTAARHAAEKQVAWHRWWQTASSTFNALIEQEGLTSDTTGGSSSSGDRSDDGGGSTGEGRPQPQQDSDKGAVPLCLPHPPHAAPKRTLPLKSSSIGSSPSTRGSRWHFWRRRGGGEEPCPPAPDLRRGSMLFELPSGFAVSQMISGRGLLEDLRVGAEVAVGRAFGAARRGLHRMLWLDSGDDGPEGSRCHTTASDTDSPADLLARHMRRRVTLPPMPALAEAEEGLAAEAGAAARPPRRRSRRPPLKSLLRSGRHWEEDLSVWTASDVILREGYPLEQHSVTTSDGYVLQMHRIPRHGGKDVAFFHHGVLDTSLGWVANGVVGSAAFAAYDAGFDVWLANSRSNAPRLHVDVEQQGSRYWRYSINEMGIFDTTAEITHIHNTKMAELATPGRHTAAVTEQQQQQMRRAATDSQLDALRWVDVHSVSSRSDLGRREQQGPPPLPQQQQQEQGGMEVARGSSPGGQRWWQCLTRQHSVAPQRDLAMRPAGNSPTPLRRTQSASNPLQQGRGQDHVADVTVPISLPLQQPQRESAGSSSGGGNSCAMSGSSQQEVLPYCLQAVGHSLGAATLLIYAVVCRLRGQPHRLRRLILMSPAGFHPTVPVGLRACKWVFPALVWLVDRTPGLRGRGMGLRLPSPLLRYIAFKFTMDLRRIPALHDLVKAGMRMMLSGDSSQWDAALQMPHYSTYSMPALSLHSGAHFAQWSKDLSFRLFDYGSAAVNREHYGTDRPPSIAEHYHLLGIPVDLLAGGADGIIPPACVVCHVQHLRAAGVPCSFRILPLGHMDFTMAVKGDIRLFVLSKLRQPLP